MSEISRTGNLKQNLELQSKKEVTQEKLKEVADMYEKHFIGAMMKQMKSTVVEGTGMFKKNNAEKIFQEQLDDQYSSEWSKQGTFGLSQIILEQLNERFGTGPEKIREKPSGPIELNEKTKIKNLDSENGLSLKIIGEDTSIKNPWAGTLHSKETMEGNQTVYKIKHDNGLESLISIQGGASEKSRFLSKGDYLQAGEELGRTASASPLFWTIRAIKGETENNLESGVQI